jgi:hypothetical protein
MSKTTQPKAPSKARRPGKYDWYVNSHGIAQAVRPTKREALAVLQQFEAGELKMEGVRRGSKCYLTKSPRVVLSRAERRRQAELIKGFRNEA